MLKITKMFQAQCAVQKDEESFNYLEDHINSIDDPHVFVVLLQYVVANVKLNEPIQKISNELLKWLTTVLAAKEGISINF